jgi:DNA-binding transcriptional regulator YhcF (GntR family)
VPDSYPFPMYSGLLEPEHYKKIGSALWLFLWCVSSTTKEVERDGVNWGIVLGNKPLKKKDIAPIFDVSEKTVERWINDLEKYGYIKTTRAPHGLIFSVRNSKKYINKRDKSVVSVKSDTTDMSVHSDDETTNMSDQSDSDTTYLSKRSDKSVASNKDITKINKKDTTTATKKDDVDLIAEHFASLRSIQEGKDIFPNARDYSAIAQIVAHGVPFSRTIELLDQCFKEFGERDSRGKIKAFKYCLEYIMDHWDAEQAKEQAKNLAKRRIPDNDQKHSRSAGPAAPKGDALTGGQIGRIKRRKV